MAVISSAAVCSGQRFDQLAAIAGEEGFIVSQQGPVLGPGDSGEWDSGAIGSMTVVKVGDVLHMYYEAWAGDKEGAGLDFSSLQIGHATSRDGVNWIKDPANPVISKGPVAAWDADGTWDPYLLYENGVYKLWYGGGKDLHCDFGYAESTDGSNFEKRGQISHIGQLSDQHVVKDQTAEGYHFYYFDKRFEPRNSLFVAKSSNETSFDFDNAEQVVIAGEAAAMVKFSQVIIADDCWWMFYANFARPNAADSATRLAYSDDGKSWTRVDSRLFAGHDAEVVVVAPNLYVAYFSRQGSYNQPGCDVQMAVYKGDLNQLRDKSRHDATANIPPQ